MNLKEAFIRTFREEAAPTEPRAPAIPQVAAFSPLVGRLWKLCAEAQLPSLSDEEVRGLATLLDPELGKIAGECTELLKRRPDLGQRLGLSAESLEELTKMDLELARIEPLLQDLVRSARSTSLALSAALGAMTARVFLHVQEKIDDESQPVAERQRLLTLFGGAFKIEQELRARQRAPRASTERKAAALLGRIEAAEGSQAVMEAMDFVRKQASALEGGPRS